MWKFYLPTLKEINWNKNGLNLHSLIGSVMFVTRGTSQLDSRDFCYQTINSTTFITDFTWVNYHISSMIWEQSKRPQSLLSDAQLKDVKLGFFYTVLVLAVNTSNIILKRTHLAKKRDQPGSLTVTGRLSSLGVTEEDKRNGYMIRKAVVVVGGGKRGVVGWLQLSCLALSWEPGG